MLPELERLTVDELLDIADKMGIDQCRYCAYRHDCNHCAINNYGKGPVESPCTSDPDLWVDEDDLREILQQEIIDRILGE